MVVETDARRWRRIEAFHASYRRLVADLTRSSPALEDLCESFPALVFALATGYASPAERQRASELVIAGAALREASDALGLPWWLRKLPPQAFAGPLPAVSDAPAFAFRIASAIPSDPRLASAWLMRVAQALEACGPDYAYWLARQNDLAAPPDEFFAHMAAWAWFSDRPGLLGNRLLRKPWHPGMSFRRAREELAAWRQRLRMVEWLGLGIETPWLADGTAAGFSFVALRTVDDFVAESQALDNCLDQFADQLNSGASAVFSIRKGARSVGCVEIGLHEAEITMPTIVQLRAARNRRAPPEVWQAAFAWLGSQRLEPLTPERHTPKPARRAEARRRLWGPYLAFLRGTRQAQHFKRLVLDQLAAARRLPARRNAGLHRRLRAAGELVVAPPLDAATVAPGRR